MKRVTVKQLKKHLKGLPDSAEIGVVYNEEFYPFGSVKDFHYYDPQLFVGLACSGRVGVEVPAGYDLRVEAEIEEYGY